MAGTVVATVVVVSVRNNPETGVWYIRFSDGSEVEGDVSQLRNGSALDPSETLRSVLVMRGLMDGDAGLMALVGHSASYLIGDTVIARAE